MQKSNMAHSFFRRSPRYRINHDADLTVTIDAGDGTGKLEAAELLDISDGGAKFKTRTPIEAKQFIAITIHAGEAREPIEVQGEVRWAADASENERQLGCAFTSPIRAEVLDGFAQVGVLDRRLNQRDPVSLAASAKWELQTQATPVKIVDYSAQGGFCLMSPFPARPGSRVELLINKAGREVLVRGEERWQCKSDEGHQIGCEFMTGQDAVRFAEVLSNCSSRGTVSGHAQLWLRQIAQARMLKAVTLLGKRRQVRRQLSIFTTVGVVLLIASVVFFQRWISPAEAPVMSSGTPIESSTPTVASSGSTPASSADERHDLPQRVTALSDDRHRERHPEGHRPQQSLEESFVAVESDESLPPPAGLTTTEFDSATPEEEKGSSQLAPESSVVESELLAAKAFRSGCLHYQSSEFHEALEDLKTAVDNAKSSPVYRYVLAMAQYQLEELGDAESNVHQAAEFEQLHPVANWGREMESFQGPARFWLEGARRRALANAESR